MITFDFNDGEAEAEADNSYSEAVGSTTLVIESSEPTDIVTNAYNVTTLLSNTPPLATGNYLGCAGPPENSYQPQGTISFHLQDDSLFDLQQFVYVREYTDLDTFIFTSSKGSETFVNDGDKCQIITPTHPEYFTRIDGFTVTYTVEYTSLIFDDVKIF